MFGQLKENIVYKLALAKSNPAELKTQFNAFKGALNESADLKKFNDIYEMVESATFEHEGIAKEFLDECLNQLAQLNRAEVAKLQPLAEGKNVAVSAKSRALDQILFNEDLNIKEKYDQKTLLIKSLTDKTTKPDFKEMINTLDKKVTTSVGKMTNEQKEALEIFMENDSAKIGTYYSTLVEATIENVEEKILATEGVEDCRTLVAVKKRLQQLKSQPATIDTVDSILQLKQDLNA